MLNRDILNGVTQIDVIRDDGDETPPERPPFSRWYHSLPGKVIYALKKNNVTSYEDVAALSIYDILGVRGVGQGTLLRLVESLRDIGLRLSDSDFDEVI